MSLHSSKEEGYSVLDVSRYIINYCIDNEQPITNGKLQKLLFYVQASFLVELGLICFREDIIAWRLGAVVKEDYDEYYLNGLNPIIERQEIIQEIYYDNKNGKIIFKKTIFNSDKIFKSSHKAQINKILDAYLEASVYDLIIKNQMEEPLINVNRNEIISKDIIQAYYSQHKEKLYQLQKRD